ncbi:MAG: hypothetical protein KJ000_33115 [Pirellulaceae bacterium]|nr:hypothetical protein [Pirellulaceae bacterium]
MNITWSYPIYLIPHGAGYVSILARDGSVDQMLVVYTCEQSAIEFMDNHGLPGEPRPLQNGREFRWLLDALRKPVTRVAFDPQIIERQAHPRWELPVKTLRDEHLSADFSPWNYPVYVIAQGTGFVSIDGRTSDGRPLTAIAFFTSSGRATEYLTNAGETGELCELPDMRLTRRFLDRLALEVFAVAVDPVVDEAGRRAKHCFDIATLLEKYLVAAP